MPMKDEAGIDSIGNIARAAAGSTNKGTAWILYVASGEDLVCEWLVLRRSRAEAEPTPKPVMTPLGLTTVRRWKPWNQPRRPHNPLSVCSAANASELARTYAAAVTPTSSDTDPVDDLVGAVLTVQQIRANIMREGGNGLLMLSLQSVKACSIRQAGKAVRNSVSAEMP
jgi:hypothetical protein